MPNGQKHEIFVIDPGVRRPEVDSFNHIKSLSDFSVSYHLPCLVGMDSVTEQMKRCTIAGVIVMGSAASVNDDAAWQKPMRQWLLQQMEAKIPILGLCFGHQLFAHMNGGTVARLEGKKQLGFRQIHCDPAPRFGGFAGGQGDVFVSHEEHVTSIPASMQVWARSPLVPVEALQHKEYPVWSFQSHIEATGLFCRGHQVPAESSDPRLQFGQKLLQSFLRVASQHRAF